VPGTTRTGQPVTSPTTAGPERHQDLGGEWTSLTVPDDNPDSPDRTSTTVADVEQQAASIALADLEPPFAAVFVEVTKMTTGQALHINWCAEPGDEELLLVGYDAARMPRSVVDCIVARRYGVPAEVFEVTI
jgi:hypothetical protein